MKPQTALELYQLFVQSDSCQKNFKLIDNLRTLLRLYILPSYGFTSESLQQDLEDCLNKVSLTDFHKVEEILNQSLRESTKSGKSLSQGTIKNYHSVLNRWLDWLRKQPWYIEPAKLSDENRSPKVRVGKSRARSAEEKRLSEESFEYLNLTDFKTSTLQEELITQQLRDEIEDLHRFWTEPEVMLRKGIAISETIFRLCLNSVYVFLGWLVNEKQITTTNLSLAQVGDPNHIKEFIAWGMEHHSKDYCWASDVAKVAVLVAKWQNQQSKHQNFGDITQIKAFRKYIHEIRQKREDTGIYGLKADELAGKLKAEFDLFQSFWRDKEKPSRKKAAISPRTFQGYQDSALWFLGWLKNICGEPTENICLAKFAELELLKKFIAWGINKRSNGYGWSMNVGYGSLAVAKYLNPQAKYQDFSDVDQVKEIREYVKYLRGQHRDEDCRQDLDKKRLTFWEAQLVVDYLKQCCAPLDKYGDERSEKAVMRSWQRFLLIAILVYCPVRQREIRELEINKTLSREADGYWVKLNRKQHKTGGKKREAREYPLPKHLTPYIDEWLQTWRIKVPTTHKLVFIQMGSRQLPENLGLPLGAGHMIDWVTGAVYNATAVLFNEPKDTTPHIFRRIAITYQRQYGRAEQKESLADLMGHSLEVANLIYNEESVRSRTQKAEGWWQLFPKEGESQLDGTSRPSLCSPWINEDQHELKHLATSTYQNDYLRQFRDQTILVLWALQELGWAELHRANIGHFVDQGGCYSLAITKADGAIDRKLTLKEKIAKIVLRYLEARQKFGETLVKDSPLFIGVGNRSGSGRLYPRSIQFIVEHHVGSTWDFE